MVSRKSKAVTDLRSYARSFTHTSVETLAGIARASENDGARVAAAIHLLDRGWGKAEQVHSGEVHGAIEIILRQIIDGAPQTKTIEHES